MDSFIELFQSLEVSPTTLALVGIGIGVFFLFVGVSTSLSGTDTLDRRMSGGLTAVTADGTSKLISPEQRDPRGLLRAFIPQSESERNKLVHKLHRAGIYNSDGLFNFYVVRSLLGIGLPVLYLALVFAPQEFAQVLPGMQRLGEVSASGHIKIVTGLAVVGFYAPSFWLKNRISKRKTAIEQSLPGALDLLQVSVEAGLGFDAAMDRVARELMLVSPELSQEFTIIQLEIHAGKDRERAFLDMADRTGVEEMSSFTNVVLQSQQYGTSVSEALSTYAKEMRLFRELRAQEKANKLPVQMSGIMAGLMMPALLMICLTPVLIRWIRVFSD